MSRRSIMLVVSGLLVIAGGFLLFVKQRGERRLDAAMERFETEIGTLDPLAHAPPELSGDENAAVWLKQGASALLTLSGDERVALNELWEREGDPGPGVEALLERHATALEHLRRAGELRASSWGIRYDAGTDAPLPDLLPHLSSKKILAADARAALAAGDRDRVLADARSLTSLRRALEREPLLIFQLIALSVELAHHELIQQTLSHENGLSGEPAGAAILQELADQLDVGAAGRSMRAALAVEAARMIHSVNSMVADEGSPWLRLRNLPMRMWAPMEYASGVDLYYRMAKATEMSADEIQRYLSTSRSPTPGMRVIAQTLVPNIIDGLEKGRASAAARRLAGLALEVRLYGLEHGAYPDNLGSFPGADLTDPYSGGALHYTLHPDGSAVVSFPEGGALWKRDKAYAGHHQPRFVWTLPTP